MMSQFGGLDETMCRAPVCQHPQCWMTFGRLERGVARYRPLEESSEPLLDAEERLPVLTVCNLSKPQPPAAGRHIYVPASPLSLDATQAAGLKESQQSQSRKCLPASKMLTKIGVMDVSLSLAGSQDIENRQTSLVWIPNSQYRSVKPAPEEGFTGEEPLKIGIKDFTLDSEVCRNEKSKERNRAAQKPRKGKKLPTRRNLNLSLRGGPAPPRGSTKNRISASSEEEKNEETSENTRAVCGQYPRTWCLLLPIPKFPKPENRRLVLHDTKEKTQQSATSPVTAPVYKLDDKFPGILSEKEVDLESIRNQHYLWKKYSSLADSSGRISTSALDQQTKICQASRAATGLTALRMMGNTGLFPCDRQSELSFHMDRETKGSVRSNTAQSCDASFGSFSPSPRTDPDSQAVQGSSPEPPCYENMEEPAQAPEHDSAPLHNTKDALTMDPPVQTESKICDLDQKLLEERPPTTPPNPPPPSPTHTSQ